MSLKDQAKDSALACALVCLIIGLHTDRKLWYAVSAAVIIALMVVPQIFMPLGRLWFNASRVMGNALSRIVLSFVYGIIITPVGTIRRSCGADPMRLKLWKRGSGSVFQARRHTFSSEDFRNAY